MAPDRITYPYLKTRFMMMKGLLAMFTLISFALAVWWNGGSMILSLIGLLLFLFFCGALWVALHETRLKRAPFQITNRGILLGRLGPDIILWQDIEDIGFFQNRNSLSISLRVVDFEPYVNPPCLPLKIWRSLSLSRWMGTLSMSLDMIEGSEAEYIDTIETLKPPGKEYRYWLDTVVPPPGINIDEELDVVGAPDDQTEAFEIEGKVIRSSEEKIEE